jgi:hypothetical protein
MSAIALELETGGMLVNSAYGYIMELPINMYGETVVLGIQNLIILSLVYVLSKQPLMRSALTSGVFMAGIAATLSGNVSVPPAQ